MPFMMMFEKVKTVKTITQAFGWFNEDFSARSDDFSHQNDLTQDF